MTVRSACECGGSWAQHQHPAGDPDEGCWGVCCLGRGGGCVEYVAKIGVGAPSPLEPNTADPEGVALAVAGLREGTTKMLVFKAIRGADRRGASDDEVESIIGRSHQSVSAARNGLAADGVVVDSGMKRLTRWGHPATVWVAAGLQS